MEASKSLPTWSVGNGRIAEFCLSWCSEHGYNGSLPRLALAIRPSCRLKSRGVLASLLGSTSFLAFFEIKLDRHIRSAVDC